MYRFLNAHVRARTCTRTVLYLFLFMATIGCHSWSFQTGIWLCATQQKLEHSRPYSSNIYNLFFIYIYFSSLTIDFDQSLAGCIDQYKLIGIE